MNSKLIKKMVNPLGCRKETFIEIVNSVPNQTNKLFKDLEKFFKNTVPVDVKIFLDLCILVIISFVFVFLVKQFSRSVPLERKSRVELLPPGDSEESVDAEETDNSLSSANNDSVVEGDGVTLEVEENKRKKVSLVKRKSVSAAPNLTSYRLKHAKPKPKLITSFDILQYMFVFLLFFF